jgi:hypothetical protein
MLEDHDFDNQEMQYLGRRSMHSFCSGAAVDHKKQGAQLWESFGKAIAN